MSDFSHSLSASASALRAQAARLRHVSENISNAEGDILTVVIELDEQAEISNDTNRSRTASESLEVPGLFGLPQRAADHLPEGASLDEAVSIDSASSSKGKGSVKRKEKLTLRVAATVIDVLPNGCFRSRVRRSCVSISSCESCWSRGMCVRRTFHARTRLPTTRSPRRGWGAPCDKAARWAARSQSPAVLTSGQEAADCATRSAATSPMSVR